MTRGKVVLRPSLLRLVTIKFGFIHQNFKYYAINVFNILLFFIIPKSRRNPTPIVSDFQAFLILTGLRTTGVGSVSIELEELEIYLDTVEMHLYSDCSSKSHEVTDFSLSSSPSY
jgi:hypothetical protein